MNNDNCITGEDSITCPAISKFNFGGLGSVILNTDMSCPLDIVGKTSFTQAYETKECSCAGTTLKVGTEEEKDITCTCFICPEGSRLDFAFHCDTAIVNECFSFTCEFECNGDMNFPSDGPESTHPPSFSPTPTPSFTSTTNRTDEQENSTDEPEPTPPPTPDHECKIKGNIISCPISVDFENNSDEATLHTNIMCPLDAIGSSGEVNYEDCACKDSKLEVFGVESPINCNCFACPEGSMLDLATICDSPIVSDCMSFNCDNECNGPLVEPIPPPIDFTFSPTSSPIQSSAPAMAASFLLLRLALVGLALLCR